MNDTTTGQLALATTALGLTEERLRAGITADDLPTLTRYLHTLVEHAIYLTGMAETAITTADEDHPTRTGPYAWDVQAGLGHLGGLFAVALHHAHDTDDALAATNPETGNA